MHAIHCPVILHFALTHLTEILTEISVKMMHISLLQYFMYCKQFDRWKEEMSTIITISYNLVRCGVMRFGGGRHGGGIFYIIVMCCRAGGVVWCVCACVWLCVSYIHCTVRQIHAQWFIST